MIFRTIEKIAKWIVRRLYGVGIVGEENIPNTGSALLVSNHVSYVDAIILASIAKRRVHFLMWREFYDLPVLGFFARKFGATPVSASDGPHAMRKSLDAAVGLLKQGHILCIFPEGAMTRTAHVQPFKRGRTAGRVQHRQAGPQFARPLRQGRTIHAAGQVDVGKQDVDRRPRVQAAQRFARARHRTHLEALLPER